MMKEAELTESEVQIVHKVVYLMNEYPGKTINNFVETFLLPEVGVFDCNLAIWHAQDLGYVVIDDPKFDGSGTYTVDRVPDEWNFGSDVEGLLRNIPYIIGRLNEEENDIMERQLQIWFSPNYYRHDFGIAIRKLLNDKVLGFYTLTNVNVIEPSKKAKGKGAQAEEIRDVYGYYTLYENNENRWGIKQFEDPSKVE